MPQQPTQKPRFGQDPTARPNRRSTLSLGVTSVAAERRAQAQQDFHTAATLFMEVQRSDVPIAKEVADTRVGPAFAACHCMSDAVARQEVSEDPASIHRSSGVEEYVNAVKHFKDVLDQALIHDRAARLQYLERLQSAWRTDLLSLLPARNTAEEELLKAPLEIVRDEERGGPSARQHASAKELALQVIRSRAVSGEVQTFMVHFMNERLYLEHAPAEHVEHAPTSRRSSTSSSGSSSAGDALAEELRRFHLASIGHGHRPALTSRQCRRSRTSQQLVMSRYGF